MTNLEVWNRQSVAAYQAAQGKKIASVEMRENVLRFTFTDDTRLTLSDQGQSCCEQRYMTTDDDLTKFVGATFVDIDLRDVTSADDPRVRRRARNAIFDRQHIARLVHVLLAQRAQRILRRHLRGSVSIVNSLTS